METKEPDSRLSVRKEDLEDQELYHLNKVINDLYSKVSTARDETASIAGRFVRSGVIKSGDDQSTASIPPPIDGGIPQPAAADWTLNPVVYSAGEDGLQYGFASASVSNKPAGVDYYSMFIQDYSSGYVDTSGTTVTLTAASKEAGNTFENCVKDQVININNVAYVLAADAVAPFESVTITSSAGTQTNVYFNLNPVDGKWEEIASDAEAGTWQPRPPTGWDVPCCLTASTKDQKTFEPPAGVNYKRLQFAAWGDAPQVTNFLVSIENQPPATTDIPSGKFVVNFTKPLDPEYYYASIERLWYINAPNPTPPYWVGTQNIGATARVDVNTLNNTITYNGSSNGPTFTGQYFTHIQPGDTVYVGGLSTLTDANSYIVSEVISNTQLKLTTSPPSGTNVLFAQWERMAGEINPFAQVDYWPLPTSPEYWKFRARSVNHREVANNTAPPETAVTVPASGGITPLTPATPLGPSDWALNPLQTSTDEAGNSYVFISATITTPSPNADYYSLFWQKTTAPTSGDWIEIAADATAGTWQPWPAEGADYAVAIAANKNTYKLQQPQNPIINATDLTSAQNGQVYVITTSGSTDFTLIGATSSAVGTVFTKSGGTGSGSGAVSKAVSIPAWGDANQVTNFSVSVETDNKAGVESGRFVVNFDPPVDLDYYYTSIERLLYDVTTSPPWPAGSNIGATAIVDVNSSTRVITYTTSGWPSGFVGQKFAYIQDGDTVYLGTASTLTDSNAYTVEEVISSTQLKLTTVPAGSPTGVLFAQWGRIAGEVNPFTQVDYWPLPGGNGERWKFRARSVNYRRRANNVSPPTFDVVVSASSGVNLVDMVKTTSSPTWSVEGGTVVIKSTNTNAPIEVNNTNALVLSTGYVGPNQIGVRNTTSGNFYPYATLNRSTGSGWASLNTYGGPALTTTDSWASIYASTIPANSYALFRNMPIQVGDSTAAGGTTVIDEYRRGFFTDLNANVFRLGTTATAGYVLTTDASGIGTWQAAGAAAAAGSTGQVQYNNAGVLAATASFSWDNTNQLLQVASSSTDPNRGIISSQHNNDVQTAGLYLRKSRGSLSSPTVVASGDFIGALTGQAYDGSNYISASRIAFQVESTPSTGSVPVRMVFQTGTSGGGTERMRIDSSGNVSINTSTSGSKLQVVGTASLGIGSLNSFGSGYNVTVTGANAKATTSGNTLFALMTNDALASNPLMLELDLFGNSTATSRYATISCSEYGTGNYRSLALQPYGGNVGIGTLSPDALLTVNTIASFGDGAEATPSIAHKGDLNTGFWFPAVDTVAVSTDGAERWRVTSAGFLIPADSDTYDIGVLSTNRVRAVYAKFIETSQAGGVGDYVKSRLFRFVDTAGGAGYWDTFANASVIGSSNFSIKDNSGSRLMVGWRASLGSPVNYTYWYSDLIPALRSIAGGDAVNDTVYPTLGSSSDRWSFIYGAAMDLTGNLSAAIINATGSPAYRVSGTTVIDSSRNGSFVNVTSSGFFNGSSTTSYYDTSYNSSGAPYRLRGSSLIDNGGVWISAGGVNMNAGCAATGYNIFGGGTGQTATLDFTGAGGFTVGVNTYNKMVFTGGVLTAYTL